MRIITVLSVILLLLVPSVYCQWSREENVRGGIKFTISAQRDSYTLGEPIVIYLEFENVSDKKINFYFSKCPVEFLHLYIYDMQDNEIFKTRAKHESPCYPNDAKLVILQPGESYRDTDTIDTKLWGPTKLMPFAPGTYKFGYRYATPQYWTDIGMEFWQERVKSNKIILSIQ